jgi:predicted permease
MEDLIIAVLQFLFEFTLEIFSYTPLDWPSRSRSLPESETIAGKCVFLFVVGCGLAWLSVLILKHTMISLSALRIANLVLAPITSAFISQAIARHRSKRNRFINPRNHFWQAFWFTLGIVTVRFAYAVRH